MKYKNLKEIKVEEEFVLVDWEKKHRVIVIKCPEDVSGFEIDTLEKDVHLINSDLDIKEQVKEK